MENYDLSYLIKAAERNMLSISELNQRIETAAMKWTLLKDATRQTAAWDSAQRAFKIRQKIMDCPDLPPGF